jgi:hypothetical protein
MMLRNEQSADVGLLACNTMDLQVYANLSEENIASIFRVERVKCLLTGRSFQMPVSCFVRSRRIPIAQYYSILSLHEVRSTFDKDYIKTYTNTSACVSAD